MNINELAALVEELSFRVQRLEKQVAELSAASAE